jgi:2-polyprenyl-3-methyl-5-hydroxy-6-metoxy-1,4-benzoquinol methylase
MTAKREVGPSNRKKFDEIYDANIIGGGFFESDDYYRRDRERYWRSLKFMSELNLPSPARILEIGGGQMAVLCKSMFNDDCAVGDISEKFVTPILRQGIPFILVDLTNENLESSVEKFDVVVLLEVIEHVPIPAYVLLKRIARYLKPGGTIFLTTPNLFRLRNFIRMFLGIEFLDRFLVPEPGRSLGHQLEYSADHLKFQFEQAGLSILFIKHDELGRVGHSFSARLARLILSPLTLRPIWRDGLVAAALVKTPIVE